MLRLLQHLHAGWGRDCKEETGQPSRLWRVYWHIRTCKVAKRFCCCNCHQLMDQGTEGSGKKAKRCNQSGEVPWQYEWVADNFCASCKLTSPKPTNHTTAFKDSWTTFFNSQMYFGRCLPTLHSYSVHPLLVILESVGGSNSCIILSIQWKMLTPN